MKPKRTKKFSSEIELLSNNATDYIEESLSMISQEIRTSIFHYH